MSVRLKKKTGRSAPWLRDGVVLAASLGLLLSTTAFRCPGPDPSAGPDKGGAGPGGTGTPSSSSGSGGDGSTSSGGCSADLMSDPASCGACGRACAKTDTLAVACVMGLCESPCAVGKLNLSLPPAPLPDDGCETSLHRVFVTSQPVTGDMNGTVGGALAGDGVCAVAATMGGLVSAGTWRAWLSDSATSPAVRYPIDKGPYILPDGTLVAGNWADLTDGTLLHAIDQDELGGMALAYDVWTGTGTDGTKTTPLDPQGNPTSECINWTTKSSDTDWAVTGNSAQVDASWTSGPIIQSCYSTNMHLYCFEE